MIKQKYDENSIESISAREFTRLRPGVYCGDTTYSTQLVKEIFSNALDEHIAGRCNEITVEIQTKDNIYSIKDNGQGFPINVFRDDGETVLQAAFDVMNTSGKYRNGTDESCYSGSIGTNGCGSKLTNFLSSWLKVYTVNNNKYEFICFKDGLFDIREVGNSSRHNGTEVTWKPDPQFFQNKEADISDLKKLFKELSALCPDLTIKFIVDSKETLYHTKNGIQDLLNIDKEVLTNSFYVRKVNGNSLFDICMTYTSDYSENITAYVNYGLTESGVHISTVRAGLTRQINKYAIDNGLLKKKDDLLTQSELNEGLVLVFNVKANNVKYDSQTKVRVVDLDKTLINQVMNNDFVTWLINNPKDAKIIIEKALIARKARDAAKKAKDGIRNAGAKNKKFISLPTKLVDSYSKDRSECELFITEGDSAAANLITKRDGKTQAVFPIRGKVLSCRKATIDKIYANQEISNICKAIGLDIDKATGKLIYNTKKLRYNKIILACDGDVDGKNIRSLLINMFWEICKELVINGHVYVALPPLFKITNSKNEYIFLRDEKALAEYKKKYGKEKYIIQRAKGLGECSADEIKYCLLDSNTRNVQQIVVKNEIDADNLLECFFGNDIQIRRKFLLDHYSERDNDLPIY